MDFRTIFLILVFLAKGHGQTCSDPNGCAGKVKDSLSYSCELGLLEETRCRLLTLEKAAKASELEYQNKNLMEKLEKLSMEVAEIKSKIPPDGYKDLHCESGEYEATGFPNPPGYPVKKHFYFKKPFSRPPAISYGITFLDADQRYNVRTELLVENLTASGFTFVMRNIADTVLYGVRGVWMACPSS